MRGRLRALLILTLGGAFTLISGWHIAVSCVEVDLAELRPRDVASLDVLDSSGARLRQEMSHAGHRGHWVKVSKISPHLIHATLASEDHHFYQHRGVDWWAMVRATLLNLKSGRFAFGGSTLTMQLARRVRDVPRSLSGKLKQMLLAARLEQLLRSKTGAFESSSLNVRSSAHVSALIFA